MPDNTYRDVALEGIAAAFATGLPPAWIAGVTIFTAADQVANWFAHT